MPITVAYHNPSTTSRVSEVYQDDPVHVYGLVTDSRPLATN